MVDSQSQGEAIAQQKTDRLAWVLGGVAALLPALLFAAHPVLTLFEQNQTELPLSVIWSPLAVTFVATAVLYGVMMLVFKSWTKAGALTALAVLAFFYFDTFKGDVSALNLANGWVLVLWLALCAVVAVLVARTRRRLGTLMLGLGIAAAVMAVVPATRIASYQYRHPAVAASDPRLWATDPLRPPRTAAKRPDIYVIIPDDYARADVLRRYFHYDNRAFAAELKRRKFMISQQARSPYSDSESNIAAELNMGYLDGLGRILGKKSEDVRPLKTMMEDNRASRLAKAVGYRWVHLDSDEVTFAGGNPGISSVATPDSFTSLWLEKSVLREFGGRFGFNDSATDERFRRNIRSSFSRLDGIPSQPGPKFVVFHTLVPHDPYIFGERGQPVTFPSTADEVIHSRMAMPYYLQQLRFVERELLETIDTIRARSKEPPVVVIESDEGFESGEKTFGEAAMQQIRVKGLVALSIPGMRGKPAPYPPNTVNVLRYLFNKVFGTRFPMLRSASYPEGDYPYQWDEMRVR
jgi:hypothetical protein